MVLPPHLRPPCPPPTLSTRTLWGGARLRAPQAPTSVTCQDQSRYSSPSLRCRWVWEPQGALGEDPEGPGQAGRLRKDLGRIQWTHNSIAEEV